MVNNFLYDFYERHPIGSVEQSSIVIPPDVERLLCRYARLVAYGRIRVAKETQMIIKEAELSEAPHRLKLTFCELSRGLALVSGRQKVNMEDMSWIKHIAISTIPNKRRSTLRALIAAHGHITVGGLATKLGISPTTADSRMEDLGLTQLATFVKGKQQPPTEGFLEFRPDWRGKL